MLWNLFVIEREKLKSARQSKSHIKSASSSLSCGDVAKRIKGGEKNSFSKAPPTPPLAKRARMKTARVWMQKHPIYAFILSLPSFFSLSHASSSSPASRASQLREKKHHVSQQPGVQITRNTTLKRASRDLKKNALALKRHANETVPFENLLDNKDDGAKDAVVHIVADILIYLSRVLCVCEEGEMCRKTSKRGSHLKRKKKKKSSGAATLEKNEYFGS